MTAIIESPTSTGILDAEDPDKAHYYCHACAGGSHLTALCGFTKHPDRPKGPYTKECKTCSSLRKTHLNFHSEIFW